MMQEEEEKTVVPEGLPMEFTCMGPCESLVRGIAPTPEQKEATHKTRCLYDKLRETSCCGLVDADNVVNYLRNKEDVIELRKKAGRDWSAGIVIFTLAQRHQHEKVAMMRAGGCRYVKKFYNPNSGNEVILMWAETLEAGSRDDYDDDDDYRRVWCCEECDGPRR